MDVITQENIKTGQSQRRAARFVNDLAVELFLRDEALNKPLAGPAHCYVHNMSPYGARLVLNQIHLNGCHLFYTPDEKQDCQLVLEHEGAERISIPVRPVWFRLENEAQSVSYFHMGVEFQIEPTDPRIIELKKMATDKITTGKGWLAKLLLKIWG